MTRTRISGPAARYALAASCLIAALAAAPVGAGAFSITTSTRACSPGSIPPCVDINIGSGPPGHSSSSIDQGFVSPTAFGYGVRESADISVEMGKFRLETKVGGFAFVHRSISLVFTAQAIGEIVDTGVKIGGATGAGVMVLPYHVTGVTNIDVGWTGFIPSGPLGSAVFGLRCTSFPSSGPGSFCGGNTDKAFTVEGLIPAAFDVLLEVPFTFGDSFSFDTIVALASSVGYNAADVDPGFIEGTGKIDGFANAGFGSTVTLGPARIFSSSGLVASPTITSDSGFDYLKGFVEVSPPDPGEPGPGTGIPAPASVALLGTGLAVAAALRARRAARSHQA